MTNRVLTAYVRAVVVAGGVVLLYAGASLGSTPRLLEWVVFSALAIMLGRFMISIGPVDASMSVADTLFIATAMLFGPEAAAVTLALDSFFFSYRKRHDWTRTAFFFVDYEGFRRIQKRPGFSSLPTMEQRAAAMWDWAMSTAVTP